MKHLLAVHTLLFTLLIVGCVTPPPASPRPHYEPENGKVATAANMAPEVIFSMGTGPTSDPFGSIRDKITGPASWQTVLLTLEFYPSTNSGFFFRFSGSGRFDVIDPTYFGDPPLSDVGSSQLSLGPSYRQFFGDRATGIFQPGLSEIDMVASDKGGKNRGRTLRGIGFSVAYTFAYRFARVPYDKGYADFEIALTPAVFYYPYFDAGRRDFGFASLVVGWLRIGL